MPRIRHLAHLKVFVEILRRDIEPIHRDSAYPLRIRIVLSRRVMFGYLYYARFFPVLQEKAGMKLENTCVAEFGTFRGTRSDDCTARFFML